MACSPEFAEALDAVTWHLSWGDAEVLQYLESTSCVAAPESQAERSPLTKPHTDVTRHALEHRAAHLHTQWQDTITTMSSSRADTRSEADLTALCMATRQCVLETLAVSCCDGSTSPDFCESVLSTVLAPLLRQVSDQQFSSPPVGHPLSAQPSSVSDPEQLRLCACYATLLRAVLPLVCLASPDGSHALTTSPVGSAALAPISFSDDDAPPVTCAVQVSAIFSTHAVPWLTRFMMPFVTRLVEPLEKQLSFHFAPGQKTASLDTPQHFFTFLTSQLATLKSVACRAPWGQFREDEVPQSSVSLLPLVAQACLLRYARTVFVHCYQWTETSPFLARADYGAAVLNALIDFAATVNSVADVHVTSDCFVGPLLLKAALESHFWSAIECAEQAFQRGTAVLWRRHFLTEAARTHVALLAQDDHFMAQTRHFLRAVDAYVSRMTRDLVPVTPRSARLSLSLWQCVVAPCALLFLRLMRVHLGGTDSPANGSAQSIGHLESMCTALGCCQQVLSALNSWSGLLSEAGTQPNEETRTLDSGAVDELILLNEQTVRDSVQLVKEIAGEMMSTTDSGQEGDARLTALRRMDHALGVMTVVLDERTSCLIADSLRQSLCLASPQAERMALRRHLESSGWSNICHVLV